MTMNPEEQPNLETGSFDAAEAALRDDHDSYQEETKRAFSFLEGILDRRIDECDKSSDSPALYFSISLLVTLLGIGSCAAGGTSSGITFFGVGLFLAVVFWEVLGDRLTELTEAKEIRTGLASLAGSLKKHPSGSYYLYFQLRERIEVSKIRFTSEEKEKLRRMLPRAFGLEDERIIAALSEGLVYRGCRCDRCAAELDEFEKAKAAFLKMLDDLNGRPRVSGTDFIEAERRARWIGEAGSNENSEPALLRAFELFRKAVQRRSLKTRFGYG